MASSSSRRVSAYGRLSASYRDRLRAKGIGRNEYIQGYTLKSPPPLTKQRLEGSLGRVARGEARPEDYGVARRWYASDKISRRLHDQPGLHKITAAAALSQVSDWSKVTDFSFTPSADPIWTATVSFSNGHTQEIQLPGDTVKDIQAWLNQGNIDNDIGGTP